MLWLNSSLVFSLTECQEAVSAEVYSCLSDKEYDPSPSSNNQSDVQATLTCGSVQFRQ